ncbi:MAG: AAA domain-containing protein, partial [Planctomycetaceae bacterium]
MTNSVDAKAREYGIGFFKLLRDFAISSQKSVLHLNTYDDHLWFHQVPELPSCQVRKVDEDEETTFNGWLEVRHSAEPECPQPSKDFDEWLESSYPFGDKEGEPPSLKTNTLRDSDETAPDPDYIRLSENPHIEADFRTFVEEHWAPWAAAHRNWRRQYAIYSKLFSIYQTMQKEGERLELVLGLGILCHHNKKQQQVVRPLLAMPGNLDFDPSQGIFTFGPGTELGPPTLELDMIEPDRRPTSEQQGAFAAKLGDLSTDLWNPDTLRSIFQSVVAILDDRGQYLDAYVADDSNDDHPIVYLAPVVILRKRSRRGVVAAYTKIIDQLTAGGPIPANIRTIAEPETIEPSTEDSSVRTRPIFPLPTNEEQDCIAENLRRRSGLLVQGPPGTGKSHTIANLISHLLANGKRVLVTAETPQALHVLRAKLPQELRSLCVSLLGHGREEMAQLESSVKGISDKESTWNAKREKLAANRLNRDLEEVLERIESTNQQLLKIRRNEVEPKILPGLDSPQTPQSLATWIRDREKELAWFRDSVTNLNSDLLEAELLETLDDFKTGIHDQDKEQVSVSVPDLCDGVTPDRIIQAVKYQSHLARFQERIEHDGTLVYREFLDGTGLTRAQLNRLQKTLTSLREQLITIDNLSGDWIPTVLAEIMSGKLRHWDDLIASSDRRLPTILADVRELVQHEVSVPGAYAPVSILKHIPIYRKYLGGGIVNKLKTMLSSDYVRVRYIGERILINHQPCTSVEQLNVLEMWARTATTIAQLEREWREIDPSISGEMGHSRRASHLEDLATKLRVLLLIDVPLSEAQSAVAEAPQLPSPAWHVRTDVDDLWFAVQKKILDILKDEKGGELDEIIKQLEQSRPIGCDNTLLDRLIEALRSVDVKTSTACLQEIQSTAVRQAASRVRLDRINKQRLAAPLLIQELEDTCCAPEWPTKMRQIHEVYKLQVA